MLDDKTDEELMLAYQLGDENAFRELYSRHSARVLGFLRKKMRNDVKANDIFQSTFLKLHKSKGLFNSSLPFVPWLFTICRSELLDALKRERRSLEDSVGEIPEVSASVKSEKAVDTSSLSAVPKQAIELRFVQDESFENISKVLETSPSNARQIVSRALKQLRSIYARK